MFDKQSLSRLDDAERVQSVLHRLCLLNHRRPRTRPLDRRPITPKGGKEKDRQTKRVAIHFLCHFVSRSVHQHSPDQTRPTRSPLNHFRLPLPRHPLFRPLRTLHCHHATLSVLHPNVSSHARPNAPLLPRSSVRGTLVGAWLSSGHHCPDSAHSLFFHRSATFAGLTVSSTLNPLTHSLTHSHRHCLSKRAQLQIPPSPHTLALLRLLSTSLW
jgi:hypothetical protein